MLRSCLSFGYKTTTTRRPGHFQYFQTLLEAKRSRKTKYRNNFTNNQRRFSENSAPLASTNMPKRKKGPKFYAVAVGRSTGIYNTWDECQSQVKGYSNARFKSFSNVEEAESFIASNGIKNKSTGAAATAEAETYSKKRPRVVAAETDRKEESISGSASNPISVESASVSTTHEARSDSRDPRGDDTNDEGGICGKESNHDEANGESLKGGKRHQHKLFFHVMFDGGSRGNPHGHAGSGTFITTRNFFHAEERNSKTKSKAKTEITRNTMKLRTYLGLDALTNNQAEYTGLVSGLKQVFVAMEEIKSSEAKKHLDNVTILIQGDSDLIVKQMNGEYACKSAKLQPYHQQAKKFVASIKRWCKDMGTTCDLSFEHVYRENNKIADGLANEAMDAQRSWITTNGDNDNNKAKEDGAIEV